MRKKTANVWQISEIPLIVTVDSFFSKRYWKDGKGEQLIGKLPAVK